MKCSYCKKDFGYENKDEEMVKLHFSEPEVECHLRSYVHPKSYIAIAPREPNQASRVKEALKNWIRRL